MVYGNMLAVNQTGQTINQLHHCHFTLEDLLCFQIIGQPAVFMRRTALKKLVGWTPAFISCLIINSALSLGARSDRSYGSNLAARAIIR